MSWPTGGVGAISVNESVAVPALEMHLFWHR